MIIEKRNILKNYFKNIILDSLIEDIENKDEGMEVFLEALHEALKHESNECDDRSMRCVNAKKLIPPVKRRPPIPQRVAKRESFDTAPVFRMENKHATNSRWLKIDDHPFSDSVRHAFDNPFDTCPGDVEPPCDI